MLRAASILLELILSVSLLFGIGSSEIIAEKKIPITTSSPEARELFLRARELQDKNLYKESRGLLEQAVALDSEFALAYRDLALAQGNIEELRKYFNKACSLTEKISEGERLWILGSEAGLNRERAKQREYFLKLVDRFPEDERAHYVLGLYYYNRTYLKNKRH
jgi:tetratricopeptide (TPR) repeat protein